VEEIEMTLAEWYAPEEDGPSCALPDILDSDLASLFPAKEGQPAHELVRAYRRVLIRDLNYWTGVTRQVLQGLIGEVLQRVETLQLKVEPDQALARMADLAIFLTTLVMNYNYTGQFVDR
jgi:hypothetical protein